MSKAEGGNTITRVVSQLSGGRPVGRVICTGHSLGAALATLGEPGSSRGVGVGVRGGCGGDCCLPSGVILA